MPRTPPDFSPIVGQTYKIGRPAYLYLPNLALVFAVPLVYCAQRLKLGGWGIAC